MALVVALFGATVLANVASARASDRAAGRIYGDDVLWATFVPTTLHPGPEQSFNKLYSFPGTDLISVTNSLPRDSDYRGGRWQVYAVTFEGTSATQFTNDAQVLAAAAAGQVSISASPVAYVLCPLFTL
ncbi:MAG: hypothetical protein E6K16_02420 [Methanobacteriota archaeon]|nr:MAG: hypothetical protein E6K16_02420 [Euryarchaeota archaeon]